MLVYAENYCYFMKILDSRIIGFKVIIISFMDVSWIEYWAYYFSIKFIKFIKQLYFNLVILFSYIVVDFIIIDFTKLITIIMAIDFNLKIVVFHAIEYMFISLINFIMFEIHLSSITIII